MSELLSRVKEIISDKLMINADEVNEASSFVDDLGADSLDTVELIMAFEDEFNVEISDEDAEKISTVGEAIAYLEETLSAKEE